MKQYNTVVYKQTNKKILIKKNKNSNKFMMWKPLKNSTRIYS